jgi:hemoglobin
MKIRLLIVSVLLLSTSAFARGKTTFEQFGELKGLTVLMDVFMNELLADPQTEPFFSVADQDHVKKMLADQFCELLDGGCIYRGRSMAESHQGMGVNRAQFNALVECLQRAMNKQKIPFAAQNKLLAKLAPMHKDIEQAAAPKQAPKKVIKAGGQW